MEVKENEYKGPDGRLDLAAAREKLRGKKGKEYWRSLDEIADTPEFQLFLEDEFPNRSTIAMINRRDLLKFMGASVALAGLAGCRGVFLPQEKLVPYVKAPEEMVPGIPLYYASSVVLAGYATGVLVEQREGRPIKYEGNPQHPASLGALDALSQAELLNLYDPDRTTHVVYHQDISTWELFNEAMKAELANHKVDKGARLRILTGAVSSPSQLDAMKKFIAMYPGATWHSYEPVGRGSLHEAMTKVAGQPLDPVYNFSKAKVVLSLDSDFLSPTGMPGSLRYAREFADGRRVQGETGTMNRLYAIEASPTLVGIMADHRWSVKPSHIHAVARSIASRLGVPVPGGEMAGIDPAHMDAMIADLKSGGGMVVCGDLVDPEVHALTYAMNAVLGAPVTYIPAVDAGATAGTIQELTTAITSGKVDTLMMFGANPVYDAPSDLKFGDALKSVRLKIQHNHHLDETGLLCDWVLPTTHTLEEWGDGRAYDGTVSMIQPLIAPLFEGRSVSEVLFTLMDKPMGSYEIVRNYWLPKLPTNEIGWRKFVHDGVLPNSKSVAIGATAQSLGWMRPAAASTGTEIAFRADPTIYDGRFANNGWLQELPKPITKMTWDNVAMMSPTTALNHGVLGDDLMRLTFNGTSVQAGVFIQPGQPDDVVTVHLGYGRTAGGIVATPWQRGDDNAEEPIDGSDYGGGFDAYQFRTTNAMFHASGLEMEKIGKQINLATTQTHQPIEAKDRPPAMEGSTVAQFEGDDRLVILEFPIAEFLAKGKEKYDERQEEYKEYAKKDMFVEKVFEWDGEQWAMTIDLNTCIGCNACVTACQAENNIPVVGKPAVGRHREMHWIRIDRYYRGTSDNPEISFQPIMCVHCEKAPCEPVCPVAATVHSHDGINQMIYNRCVGTRYCSNNCPYKVRRFNYLNFTDNQPNFDIRKSDVERRPLLKMINNPDVTVRGRGVMEKCTYCVQRINSARIESKKTQIPLKDGDVVTACQQACPTKTIVFGNQRDPSSEVARLRQDPRSYLLLQELLTYPRTSHLAKLRNPNPAIPVLAAAGGAE